VPRAPKRRQARRRSRRRAQAEIRAEWVAVGGLFLDLFRAILAPPRLPWGALPSETEPQPAAFRVLEPKALPAPQEAER